jgi:tyrosyl-tRNA synthetase
MSTEMNVRTDGRSRVGAPLDSDANLSEIPLTSDLDPGGLLAELRWRGMLQDATPGLEARLTRDVPLSAYNGFDPTASSLHVGHLVPVFGLQHLQRHGHRPVVVVGGGTGMIGDPSGRSSERVLQTRETIVGNVAALRVQLERFLDFAPGPIGALMVDNFDWLGPWSLLDFLRDIGKHFTVPYMLAKDSVQVRLKAGLSFTEFSYMLLQSADFLHLYRTLGVEAQLGGADQWGNITAGLELIRRVEGGEAYGLSFPLHMNASGEKFGKSNAGGNVWLDPAQTSPFEFYQYWFGASDTDVGALLRKFTLLDRPTIERVEALHAGAPERRLAQRVLARDITSRVHGEDAAARAERESEVRFRGTPGSESDLVDAEVGPGDLASAVDFATMIGAASSRSEARRLITQGGFTVNDDRILDPTVRIPPPGDGRLRVRIGKRRVLIVQVREA